MLSRDRDVTKRNKRASAAAVLLVTLSLLLAATACYSGQVSGVFELTPFVTPTPLPVAADAEFSVLDVVLAPREAGRSLFNLTVYPEPLLSSFVNSKTMCGGDSAATVLYAGQSDHGEIYYLIECAGSVGWAAQSRLAGPLKFSANQFAIAVAPPGQQAVDILDERTFQPMPPNPLMQCKPETIVSIRGVQAADPDGDGKKSVFYAIDCPSMAGPVRGWVTNEALFGPVEINVGDRALAVEQDGADTTFVLASEPAPVTEANAVDSEECREGTILEALAAQRAGDTAYFQVRCGDITGWTQQDRFVGPLLYDRGDAAVTQVEPLFVFEDELPALQAAEAAIAGAPAETVLEGEAPLEGEADETAPEVEPDAAQELPSEDDETSGPERRVVEYTPPLTMTDRPGVAVPGGEAPNVVGVCPANSIVMLEDFAGVDTVYYEVTCDICVQTQTDEDGNLTCAVEEARTGWLPQKNLIGPLDFAEDDRVTFETGSKAVETGEDGVAYARIPANTSGAESIGRFTEFAGRCPFDAGMTVIGVEIEQARTSSAYNFYYRVECEGQPATTIQVADGSVTRPEVVFEGGPELIQGWAAERDLVRLNE